MMDREANLKYLKKRQEELGGPEREQAGQAKQPTVKQDQGGPAKEGQPAVKQDQDDVIKEEQNAQPVISL